jgi:hypothetical protein
LFSDGLIPSQQRLICPVGQHLAVFDYNSDEFGISVNEGKAGADLALRGSGLAFTLDPAYGRISSISISSQSPIISLKLLTLVVNGVTDVTFDLNGKGDATETV